MELHKSKILDQWDNEVIHLAKGWGVSTENPITLERIKEIWSRRNAISIDHIKIAYINQHFLQLAESLGLLKGNDFIQFISELNPKNNWKYMCSTHPFIEKDSDFDCILLSRLLSLFGLTLCKKLPGYQKTF